ncbi:glycosyltransferase [Gracilibacillus sp. S3-1-1]|uniref:Glycosyltransferase n=1 Tax=Gracilibacillus pellucidus TaxID=3095368 RepID=A0ACC6M875_9BACI|nr:glycosyltransferase [Gracilibacillus sp. S3-1-1]MDX8047093.1 glycosyltransferase [Gracilibacillus sp. S3-1-1]
MIRKMKKKVFQTADWILYQKMSTKQKEFLSNLLTDKQKAVLKKVIKPGKKRTQLQKVERIRNKLNSMGFTEKGLADLTDLYQTTQNNFVKKLSGRELSLWHANQYDKEHAKESLLIVRELAKGETDTVLSRKYAIMAAEALAMLDKRSEAKDILLKALEQEAHDDLYIALANVADDHQEKLTWINKVYAHYQNALLAFQHNGATTVYDSLDIAAGSKQTEYANQPKVTIIVPTYNAEDTILTTLRSLTAQTWRNLEIIVVDDCSTDHTLEVVENYLQEDNRVKLMENSQNSGAYVARNTALQQATGEFVTINDADDWSHPEKIATQVSHLIKQTTAMANFSQQVRARTDMTFYRRGKFGQYVFANMSSFMFRRKPVVEALGFWDSVRFGGDSEFVRRVKKVFGEKSVVELKTAPLSFQRQTESSLTASSAFGFPGYFMGARKDYLESQLDHHEHTGDVYYPFPQEQRPFPVPEPMLPEREKGKRRHFDVIIASEFRLLGGTNASNVEEIKAQKELGLSTGLIQMYRYDLNSVTTLNPKVREQIDGNKVQMLVYGEKVSCDVLIVRHPPILRDWQKYLPDVEAKTVKVIVNQPPKRDYTKDEQPLYDIPTSVQRLKEYFGHEGTWYPIGPSVREALETHHKEDLSSINLSKDDWLNIINVAEWKRDKRPNKQGPIKIGRHSRAQYVKWPSDKEQLLTIYPASNAYEVHVLGGAQVPKKVLGQIPANWKVYEFGEMEPKDFLRELDVFVYYTHPGWVEAFGRVIFEAMAAGVPVVISPSYQNLFQDAAIYAEASQVQDKVKQLMQDEQLYNDQVAKAQQFVEEQFGYQMHFARLEQDLHD